MTKVHIHQGCFEPLGMIRRLKYGSSRVARDG